MRNIFLILSALLLSASCMKEVTMDAMEEPQVVVECILCDEPVQTLNLAYTKGASRESAPELLEAEAVLNDLTEGKEVGRFTRAADGFWQLGYTAVPSHRYRLEVNVPGHEPISAEQTMPEVPSLDAEWDWWRENLPADAKYRKVHGYVFSVDTLRNPVWFYGINYPDMDSEGEITENLATDYPDVDKFNEQSSTYFGLSAFDSRYFRLSVYPDLMGAANHRHYLRFPAREAERTEFLISGDFRGYLEDKTDFVHSRKRFPELHYFAVSEDYDKFLADAYQLEQVSTSSDLSSVFLRDNVYSNIQGATGIFGAKIERTLLWDDDRYWGEGPFLFSGLESMIEPRSLYQNWLDSLTWLHDPVQYVDFINGHLREHRQFSILHYEVRGSNGRPEDWKYGVPTMPFQYYIVLGDGTQQLHSEERSDDEYSDYGHSIYLIENEEQLQDHGLGGFGPVDFSRKSIIVAYTIDGYVYLPYIVDYWVQEDKAGGCCTCMLYLDSILERYRTQHGRGALHPDISCRIALVVDKIDRSTFNDVELRLISYSNESKLGRKYIESEVLPEMGVVDYNTPVDN